MPSLRNQRCARCRDDGWRGRAKTREVASLETFFDRAAKMIESAKLALEATSLDELFGIESAQLFLEAIDAIHQFELGRVFFPTSRITPTGSGKSGRFRTNSTTRGGRMRAS